MKKPWFKKLIASVCAVSIVLSAFIVQAVAASSGSADEVPLANPYATHVYGSGETCTGLWGGMKLFEVDNKAVLVDATKAKYLEFDFFIDDLSKLKKNETERAGLVISLSGGSEQDIWKQRAMYWFQDDLKNNGWNHIKIDLSKEPNGGFNEGKTDFTQIFGVMVANGDALVGESPTVRVANVALTVDGDPNQVPAPELPDNIVKVLKQDKKIVDSLKAYNCFDWAKTEAPAEYNAAKYIEMDLYVEDYAAFSVAKNGNERAGVFFHLFNKKADSFKEYAIHEFVVNNGWNHVKLEIGADVDLSKCYGYEVGPWESFNGKFGIANVCLTKDLEIVAPAAPEKVVAMLGKDKVETPALTPYHDFAVKRIDKTDYSKADVIEMDVHVDDYAHFSTAKNGNDKVGIYLHLYSGADDTTPAFDQELSVHTQITKSGWNHVRLPIDTKKVDMKQFSGYAIGPWEAYDERLAVANVCLTAMETLAAPAKTENIVKEMGMDVVEVPSLTAFHDFAVQRFDKTDLGQARYIELDVFVDDYAHFSTAKNGNAKVGIYLRPYSSKDTFDMELSVHEQILHDGWNHVRFEIDTTKVDMTQFSGYAIGPWEPYDQRFAVANVCLTKDADKPAMPQDVTYVVDENGFSYNGWCGELAFKEYDKQTFDLSGSKFFEADLYISAADYAIYEKNPQNICFSLGSNKENKWANRAMYQGKLNLTQPGWNHFKVKIEDSSYWADEPDFKNIVRVMLYHEGMDKNDPVNVRFVNMCFTAGYEEAGPDEGKTPSRPDKDAYYITDCEALMDDKGVWNSAGEFALDMANHTEGTYSIRMKFNSVYNSIRYNLNQPIDVSGADKLKLDVFISNEEVMKQFTNGFMVRLASDGNYRKNYTYANLSKDSLHTGWNTIEISIADLQTKGKADLSKMDTIGLFCVDGTFSDMDELTVKLDNIRVSGKVIGGQDTDDSDVETPDVPNTGDTTGILVAVLLLAAFALMSAVLASPKLAKKAD